METVRSVHVVEWKDQGFGTEYARKTTDLHTVLLRAINYYEERELSTISRRKRHKGMEESREVHPWDVGVIIAV